MKPGRHHARAQNLWKDVSSSYWFRPGLIVIGGALLAFLAVWLDRRFGVDQEHQPWLFIGEASSSRSILRTVASAMITIASLTFSMTLVALTLASSQFGPRLLANFMRDRVNQTALGIFVGTFVYCLLVLRTVRADGDVAFVPHYATNIAIGLGVVGVLALLVYFHHVAQSIRADHVVTKIRYDYDLTVERVLVDVDEARSAPQGDELDLGKHPREVTAQRDGLLQTIESEQLLEALVSSDCRARLLRRPGDHVIEGEPIALVTESADDELVERVSKAFVWGSRRNTFQDLECSILRLVDVAVRALSAGTNDPQTAKRCLAELGGSLATVMRREFPSSIWCDEVGEARVEVLVADFEGLAATAFHEIRQYGAGQLSVLMYLIDVLGRLIALARTSEQRLVLFAHLELASQAAMEAVETDSDRKDLQRHLDAARSKADGGAAALRGGASD
ncbi:MAG: DUF2254 domain-containing protein [Planctomycetota bacterium]